MPRLRPWFSLFTFMVQFVVTPVVAQYEFNVGPNGGVIQSPGSFALEVVPERDSQIKTYLLDAEFKNPMTEKSSVSAYVKRGVERLSLKCHPRTDYFTCAPQAAFQVKPGDMVIMNVSRGGEYGVFLYQVPARAVARAR